MPNIYPFTRMNSDSEDSIPLLQAPALGIKHVPVLPSMLDNSAYGDKKVERHYPHAKQPVEQHDEEYYEEEEESYESSADELSVYEEEEIYEDEEEELSSYHTSSQQDPYPFEEEPMPREHIPRPPGQRRQTIPFDPNLPQPQQLSSYPYLCQFCGCAFPDQTSLQSHDCAHNDGHFSCPYCPEAASFPSPEHLINHIRQDHSHLFVCPLCQRIFKQKYDCQAHLMRHFDVKPFECELCGRSFTRKGTLKTHMAVHSEERRYECEVCGALFKQKGHLIRHVNVHLEKIEMRCEICGKVFDRMDRYNTHIKTVHIAYRV